MDSFKTLILLALLITSLSVQSASTNWKLFREYIGVENKGITFSDILINPEVEVHFILSFAIDYTTSSSSASPTDGNFTVYWDRERLSPVQVSFIKARHPNVKVALSLGGVTVAKDKPVYFQPTSVKSWVRNAIKSITKIVEDYALDGIDIDCEHFNADEDTFCGILFHLRQQRVVSFASIAPYEDNLVQLHYSILWRKYGHLIDYANFQFYAYDKGTTVPQFMKYFQTQRSNYRGGKLGN